MKYKIHVHPECKVNGVWEPAYMWDKDFPYATRHEDRFPYSGDYLLYGMLAKGVQVDYSNALVPKGLPKDISPKVNAEQDYWYFDYHSASYVSPAELKQLAAMTVSDPEFAVVNSDGRYYKILMDLYKRLIDLGGEDQRMVFWFAN